MGLHQEQWDSSIQELEATWSKERETLKEITSMLTRVEIDKVKVATTEEEEIVQQTSRVKQEGSQCLSTELNQTMVEL